MKALACIFLVSIVAPLGWSQEAMSPERFRSIVAAPGDTNALRPELAAVPFWAHAKCRISFKYQDGKKLQEECNSTAKTVEGRFIVYTILGSQVYQQAMYSIIGYDEKASAIRHWGLIGGTVVEATLVFDPEKKVSAAVGYANNYMEISVRSHSEQETTEHSLLYQDGVLFLTKDIKAWPTPGAKKVQQIPPPNGTRPTRSKPGTTSPATDSPR